jgi:hypothetical protein
MQNNPDVDQSKQNTPGNLTNPQNPEALNPKPENGALIYPSSKLQLGFVRRYLLVDLSSILPSTAASVSLLPSRMEVQPKSG